MGINSYYQKFKVLSLLFKFVFGSDEGRLFDDFQEDLDMYSKRKGYKV